MSLPPQPSTATIGHPKLKSPSVSTGELIAGINGPVELRSAPDGSRRVWPRPTPESLRTLYGEKFYEDDKPAYLAEVERDRSYWDATWSMRRMLMEDALPPARRRILDVGCSGGFLLDHFRSHGWLGTGIEPSAHAAQWGRDRFDLDIYCGELLDYPAIGPDTPLANPDMPTSTADSNLTGSLRFDAIHSSQVLEHVLDPEACIQRIAELLAPGGVAYIEVPNDFNVLQETAREQLDKPAWWVAPDHHLNYFDYDSLAQLLAHFDLIEIDRLASFPIEVFLLMGEDYVGNPEVGAACHARRMAFEQSLIGSGRLTDLLKLYRSLAQASMGRTCGILARSRT